MLTRFTPACCKRLQRHRAAYRPHHDVDRLRRNRLHEGDDRIHVRRVGRIQHVRADLGKGGQAPDRVRQVRPALDEVVGPGR